MSDVNDRNVIDYMITEEKKQVLIIADPLEWNYGTRTGHAQALQDKINDYLQFIGSGQAAEQQKEKEYSRIIIRVVAEHPYSRYGLDFLAKCQKLIRENGDLCELEWTHLPKEDADESGLQDGFSDDYILEPDKIYPRIKKNWSENPTETVTLMGVGEHDFYDDIPMFRIFDSYIITLIQDLGSTYMYLEYKNLPPDTFVELLEKKAFENLHQKITYRMVESKEAGVYGLVAGGDFEAEALCLTGIWEECSEVLQDNLLIAVPTKDMVLFTRACDKKSIRRMIKQAQKIWKQNQKQSPFLIFSRDVFCYDRSTKQLAISKEYSLGNL